MNAHDGSRPGLRGLGGAGRFRPRGTCSNTQSGLTAGCAPDDVIGRLCHTSSFSSSRRSPHVDIGRHPMRFSRNDFVRVGHLLVRQLCSGVGTVGGSPCREVLHHVRAGDAMDDVRRGFLDHESCCYPMPMDLARPCYDVYGASSKLIAKVDAPILGTIGFQYCARRIDHGLGHERSDACNFPMQ